MEDYQEIGIKMKRILYFLFLLIAVLSRISAQTLVGSMGGQFAVNDMGAATYSIPIEVPVGINGMQPNVSLTYSSQTGNGVCGIGFSLSGISVITRIPRSVYYDGSAKGIGYNNKDAYALNGVRLILESGTDGINGAVYRLENDPLTKISLIGSGESQYFKVENGGTTAKYGSLQSGRNFVKSSIVAWYISEIEDSHNNYMYFSYSKIDNSLFLSDISYGLNSKATTSLLNQVQFTYETRIDNSQFITNGEKGKLSRRLKSIKSTTNGKVYREYELSYTTNDGFSRLQSVKEKGTGSGYLPITNFSWNCLTPYISSKTVPFNNASTLSFDKQYFFASDVTGNGKDNLIAIAPNENQEQCIYVYDNVDKEINLINQLKIPIEINVDNLINIRSAIIDKRFADIDGDGINDLVIPILDQSVLLTKKKYDKIEFLVLGNSIIKFYKVLAELNNQKTAPLYTVADFFQKGISSILYAETTGFSGKYQIGLNSPLSKQCDIKYNITLSSAPKRLFSADINGNGMVDLLFILKDKYVVFWNQGDGVFSDSHMYESKSFGDYDILTFGDFNGDGLLDILAHNRDSKNVYFKLSNGNGTFTEKLALSSLPIENNSFTGYDNDKFNCEILDYNGDGMSDVVITKSVYKRKRDYFSNSNYGVFQKTYTYWLKSNGEELVLDKTASSDKSEDGLANRFVTGDFNGDGHLELMNYGYNCYSSTNAKVSPQWRYYYNDFGGSAGKLKCIYGDETKSIYISYSLLTDPDTYVKDSGIVGKAINVTIPLSVVKSTTINQGAASSQTTNYKYEGLKYHPQGKGLLGFCKVTNENSTLGIQTKKEITHWNDSYYVPTKISTTVILGSKQKCGTTTTTIVPISGKRYLSYPSTITESDFDGNTTTTTNTYDSNSYCLTKARTEYGGADMYKQREYLDYIKVGGTWQPRTVISSQKHEDSSSEFVQKSTYLYDKITGDTWRETRNCNGSPVYYDYKYDDFGNVLTQKISADKITPVTMSYTYDDTNRFPIKKENDIMSVSTSYEYDIWGNIISITDEASRETSYEYDAIGNTTKTTHPDGTNTIIERGWGNSASKQYYIKETSSGQAPITTWYDNCGREVKVETYGEKGIAISSSKTYNKHGSIASETNTIGNITQSKTISYDGFGRVALISGTNTPYTVYSYKNRQIEISNYSEQSTTRETYDAWGNTRTINVSGNSSIISYEYASNGKPALITCGGASYSMEYDESGNQISLTDPDAGKTTYSYDALGRIIKTVDAKGIITVTEYDKFGNVTKSTCGSVTTDYSYGETTSTRNQLQSESSNGQTIAYKYDKYDRVLSKTYTIDGESFKYSYTYDNNGNLLTQTCPIGLTETFKYDNYGNIESIKIGGNTIWELDTYTGTKRRTLIGSTMCNCMYYTSNGILQSKTLEKINASNYLINLQQYTFNAGTGNLMSRDGVNGGKETFSYDNIGRLTNVTSGSITTQSMTYSANGNIESKTGIGVYTYRDKQPHAVFEVENSDNIISKSPQSIDYTPFNKVSRVTQGNYGLEISYGPNKQRTKTILMNGTNKTTRIYAGSYERVKLPNGNVTQYQYFYSPDGLIGVYVKDNSNNATMNYALLDHQGSILALQKEDFTTTYSATYDVWGKRTVKKNTINFQRGYTGHEHWDEFQLIDMNGRFYDPIIARFVSPDPYVQAPDNSQNFNRYTYCLNNPLKYTDPSGEFFWFIPNIGWSKSKGFSFGLSFVFGIPGVCSAQIGCGYSSDGFNMYISGTAMMCTMYASISTNSGLSAGATTGLSPYSGLPISSNFCTVGMGASMKGNYINVSSWTHVEGKSGFSFDPSFSAMLFPERSTNIVRGKGFHTNDQVLQAFVEAGDYQGALDYFGFEGTYNPKSSNKARECVEGDDYIGCTNTKTGNVKYGSAAFQSYYHLIGAYLKEYYTSYKVKHGIPLATQDDGNTYFPEERLGCIYAYRKSGIFRNKIDFLTHIYFYQINCYSITDNDMFNNSILCLMYKIPRLW